MTKIESFLKRFDFELSNAKYVAESMEDGSYQPNIKAWEFIALIEIIRIQNEALKYYGEFDLNHNISDDANCKPIYLRAQEAQQKIESLLSEEK